MAIKRIPKRRKKRKQKVNHSTPLCKIVSSLHLSFLLCFQISFLSFGVDRDQLAPLSNQSGNLGYL